MYSMITDTAVFTFGVGLMISKNVTNFIYFKHRYMAVSQEAMSKEGQEN
jgi:hypothetical protein